DRDRSELLSGHFSRYLDRSLIHLCPQLVPSEDAILLRTEKSKGHDQLAVSIGPQPPKQVAGSSVLDDGQGVFETLRTSRTDKSGAEGVLFQGAFPTVKPLSFLHHKDLLLQVHVVGIDRAGGQVWEDGKGFDVMVGCDADLYLKGR